jgi:CheY-like chemotaxis protein
MGLKDFVLVVDDDPIVVELISATLSTAGYRVSSAPDGMQAVIQAQALKPRLIISDIQMPPWGTGIEALGEMRKISALQDVPVIFMTGMPPEEAKKLIPGDPKVRMLSKPIDWTLLEQAIHELLGESKPLKP